MKSRNIPSKSQMGFHFYLESRDKPKEIKKMKISRNQNKAIKEI